MASLNHPPPVLPVLTAGDEAFLPGFLGCVGSLLHHLSPHHRIDLVYVHDGVPPRVQDRLHSWLNDQPKIERFRIVDWNVIRPAVPGRPPPSIHYARLEIPRFFPTAPHAAYTDLDVLFRRDPTDLFREFPPPHAIVSAVRDSLGVLGHPDSCLDCDMVGLDSTLPCVNSGLWLADLSRWRKAALTARAWEVYSLLPLPRRLHDQPVLNAALAGRVHLLDPSFNCQRSVDRAGRPLVFPSRSRNILHAIGPTKLWQVRSRPPIGVVHEFWRHLDRANHTACLHLEEPATGHAVLWRRAIPFFLRRLGIDLWHLTATPTVHWLTLHATPLLKLYRRARQRPTT